MNCMSVQQHEKTHGHRSRDREAYHPNTSNNSSKVRLRSCLRGEIEDAECKKNYYDFLSTKCIL